MNRELKRRLFGGDMTRDSSRLERVWDEVIALNRAAGPWGIFGKGEEA